MNKNSKLVQTLLGKKPNQPQKPDRNCPGGKMNVVGECAAQYKHGDMNSCTPQGKEIIWAEVHTLVSDPKAGCKYQPGGIKADHAPGDGPVFTYSKTAITVAGGCRANFWICYKSMFSPYGNRNFNRR